MNLVDLGVLALVAVSALLGLSRGLVREVLGLASWIGAGYAAWRFGPALVPAAEQALGNPDVAGPLAYVFVFVAVLIGLSLASNLIGRTVRFSPLGGLDRTLGLLFGVARGAAVLVAAYIPLALMLPPERWPEPLLRARSLPLIYGGAVWAAARLPGYHLALPPFPDGKPGTEARNPATLAHDTPDGGALGLAVTEPSWDSRAM